MDGNVVDFIRSSLGAPKMSPILPPSFCSQVTFSKRIDAIGNFSVDDATVPRVPGVNPVSTQYGFLLWLPGKGMDAVFRFGFVPAGSVLSANFVTTGLHALLLGALTTFKYVGETPIVYQVSDNVTISPTPSDLTISGVRLYAGSIKVSCGSVPIGATALNGYFSATAVSDVRDVWMSADFTAGMPVSQMIQAAVTQKDSVKEVSALKGVAVVIGPDISLQFSVPDVTTVDTLNGSNINRTMIPTFQWMPMTGYTMTPVTPTSGMPSVQYLGFVSPWNVQDGTPDAGRPDVNPDIVVQNINFGPINPMGTLRFDVNITCAFRGTPPPTATYAEQWICIFNHVFAFCKSDGYVYYSTFQETKQGFVLVDAEWTSAANVPTYWKLAFSGDASLYSSSYTGSAPTNNNANCAGMYLGTQIVIYSVISTAAAVTAGFGIDTGSFIRVSSVNEYELGNLGAARVVRWDGMTNGQLVKVDGTFQAECIPGIQIAPFVQDGAQLERRCTDVNLYPMLSRVYNNSGTPFGRVWDGAAWDEFCTKVDLLTEDEIVSYHEQVSKANRNTSSAMSVMGSVHKSVVPPRSVDAPSNLNAQNFAPVTYLHNTPNVVSKRLRDLDAALEPYALDKQRQLVQQQKYNS